MAQRECDTYRPWYPKAMIFAPNCTGPLDIASAVLLWLTARECLERKLELLIRFDDWQYRWEPVRGKMFQTWESLEANAATISSTRQACESLQIQPAGLYRWTDRAGRYLSVLDKMWKADLLVEPRWPGWTYLKDAAGPLDIIHGTMKSRQATVMGGFLLRPALSAVVDAIDFATALHIRGRDIIDEVFTEANILPAIRKAMPVARPNLCYAHIPMICDQEGEPLHKGSLQDSRYLFSTFAKTFPNVAQVRNRLEGIVLMEAASYALENILKPPCMGVRITPEGTRVGLLPPDEGQEIYIQKRKEKSDSWHRVAYAESEVDPRDLYGG